MCIVCKHTNNKHSILIIEAIFKDWPQKWQYTIYSYIYELLHIYTCTVIAKRFFLEGFLPANWRQDSTDPASWLFTLTSYKLYKSLLILLKFLLCFFSLFSPKSDY